LNDDNNNTQVTVTIPPEACSTPPPNDRTGDGIPIYTTPAVVVGENNCATKQNWEPDYGGNVGGRSVWWRWVAPESRQYIVSTEGSNFDTLLGVFRAVPGGIPQLVGDNDDVLTGVIQYSEVRFNATAGTEYFFGVDGYDGASGSIVLNLDPPPNDDFVACLNVAGASGSLTGHNIGATRESGEPTHASTFGSHSVWYCWTAPKSGTVEWSTIGSDFDTTLAIYSGSALNSLTPVAGDNDSGAGGTSVARFNATSNVVYRVAIDARANGMGHIALSWNYISARLAIRKNSNGTVQLNVSGSDGTYTLQASSNLTSWATVGTVNVANGTASVSQPNNTARRFFRLRSP
jgi:hypothetical protein